VRYEPVQAHPGGGLVEPGSAEHAVTQHSPTPGPAVHAETLAEAVDINNGCHDQLSVAAVLDESGDADALIGSLAMTPAEARRLADALTIAAFVASQRLD